RKVVAIHTCRRRDVAFNHCTDFPFDGSAESQASAAMYEPVAISSGNKMNCTPSATACSAKVVARLRFASRSCSTDGSGTTANRSARAADGPAELGACAPVRAEAINAVTKTTTVKRTIFMDLDHNPGTAGSVLSSGVFQGYSSGSKAGIDHRGTRQFAR